MAGKGLNLKAIISLESKQFKKGINDIKRQLGGFKNFIKSAFALGSITAFGKQMVSVGRDFEDAMARVQAVSNASTKELSMMQKEAQKLGETTKYTASEAASALENLARNGLSATQATQALSGVLQLAQANAIELSTAADILTNTMNAFGLSVNDTKRINDVLSSTAANAATNINELYEAMIVAGPYAKIMNKSIEETASVIGVLANKGIKGSVAGKSIAAMFQRLSAIAPKAEKELKKYGLNLDEATIKSQDLATTLKQLKDSGIGKSVEALSNLFGKNFAGNIAQVINSFDDFEYMLEVTKNSAGTTARMFEQGVGSVKKELDTLKSKYEGLLITISQKTGGVVKGAIKLLQNLIDNFKTVGGSIMNIASVAVPLLSSKVVKLIGDFRKFFTVLKTEGAAATAMMGGWITAIATLVTWVGTALVGAYNKAHQAMKDANKAMADARGESAKLQTATHNLLEELQPKGDKKTLAGIVNELIGLFPDFAEQIRNAAIEAGKTGNWENFKKLLTDIVDLQASVLAKSANQQLVEAAGETIANNLKKRGKTTTYSTDMQGNPIGARYSDTFSSLLNRVIKEKFPDNTKLMKDVIWKNIGQLIAQSGDDLSQTGKNINTYLKGLGINLNEAPYETSGGYITDKSEDLSLLMNSTLGLTAADKELIHRIQEGNANIKAIINQENQFNGNYNTGSTSTGSTDTSGSGSETEVTGNTKVIQDAINNYNKELTKLDNRLKAGTITQTEYDDALNDLEDKTWETITAISGFAEELNKLGLSTEGIDLGKAYAKNRTDEGAKKFAEQFVSLAKYNLPKEGTRDKSLDYQKSDTEKFAADIEFKLNYKNTVQNLVDDLQAAVSNGDYSLIPQDAIDQLDVLKTALEKVSEEADTMQAKLYATEQLTNLNNVIDDVKGTVINDITTMSQAFDRLYDGIRNIAEAFGDEIEWEGFEKFMSVINASVQIFETLNSVVKTVQGVIEIFSLKKKADAAKQVLANKAVTKSELEKTGAETGDAVAGAASSMAGIPLVGPVLAVAAVASVLAAIMAATNKFATGGIVGGSSTQGDKQLARVNSGEMILNKAQQATLFNAINSGSLGGGGNVQFRIRGTDLIGVINNTQSRIKG